MKQGGCSHGGIYSVDSALVKVDCSSSVNPLGPPPGVIEVIRKEAGQLVPQYPDPECRMLKEIISGYARCDREQVCVGNGALEIIHLFARLYATRRAVIPAPTFCEYENAARLAGASVTFAPLSTGGAIDPDSVINAAKGADAVFLCNPNNPTGLLLPINQLMKIVDSISPPTMVFVDECFIELSDRPADTLAKRAGELDNLVILRSLTKSFALAGLRLGYSISSPDIAARLQSMQVHWSVNGLAQAAGIAALRHPKGYLAKSRAAVRQGRKFLQDAIDNTKRELIPLQSAANYFQVYAPAWDSTKLRDTLLKTSGVLVRDCRTFNGMDNHHIRVAVKTPRENARLVSALSHVGEKAIG